MQFQIEVIQARSVGDDRAAVFPRSGGNMLVVADGAGGSANGALAAQLVIDRVATASLSTAEDCVKLLARVDHELAEVGQSTAVVVVIEPSRVFGASVGDSCAWLFGDESMVDLTEHQLRKPLLGSGKAQPTGFGACFERGRLLLGSDGLFNYVSHKNIEELVKILSISEIPKALIAAARLPSGKLQDDIAVVVASLDLI